MPNVGKPVVLLISAALVATLVAPSAQAQPRRVGPALGIAAGLGVLGLLLSQPRARAEPMPRRASRPVQQRAPAAQGVDMEAVQKALVARGYDVGTPNGKSGPKTRAAISAYQRDNGLPATGKLHPAQMTALVGAAGAVGAGAVASGVLTDGTALAAPPQQPLQQSPLLVATETELASGPRELPVGPNDAAWASGTWTGSTRCWQRIYDIKMVVPVATEGAKTRIEYSWRADLRSTKPSGKPLNGAGAVELGTNRRGFEATSVLSGEQDHPFKSLTLREGSENRPVFRSAPCSGELPLTRTPETVPKRQLPQSVGLGAVQASLTGAAGGAQASGTPANGIFGQWDGELKCTRGGNRQLFMRFGTVPEIAQSGSQRVDQSLMAANRAGRVAALITQAVAGNAGGGSIWTRLVGEYSEEDKSYRFAAVSGGGGDSSIANLVLRQTASGIEGTISGEPCTELKGARPDPLGSPEMPSVRLPANGGTFYAARDIGARCDALIKWGARADKEYPASVQRNQRIDTSILFIDPEFVPVFGRTIEAARGTSVGSDISNTIRECSKDPLTKPRMAFLATNIDRNVVQPDGFDWSATTFIVKNVGLTRVALNQLNVARLEATRMNDLSEAIIHLASARVRFDSASITMIPSQKAEINASIKDILSKSAERIVEDEQRRIENEATWVKLDSLRSLRLFSSPATVHLNEEARQKALARLAVPEGAAAAEAFEPMFAKAKALPASAEGLHDMDALEAVKLFVLLSAPVRDPLQAAWNTHRDEKQKEAVGQELARAFASPRDPVGLQYGAGWLVAFKQRWSAHQDSQVVKTALKYFFDDRKARLREALPSFQSAVSSTPGEAKPALLARYLALPEDQRDPISLEYEMVLAGI
ncbi:peptidoglycan-binding domain-containing protein [Bosea lathyri]|uniref:Putative peptidoglycan binding domain-containing protein n=1 Tax=Bosea lathyri TaxID=1036778 RepID=A0A1H6D1B6_9HYPH|nr:peptidoglycan-binding domain-containing protein [Bosea lathyri]SEG79161.1 Putative peptidoglycan binding domain-containing protein [Bosea lathyri]